MVPWSDRELKQKIAGLSRDLAKCKPGSWTAGKIQESLDYYQRQLSLPREQRFRTERGSL